MTDEIRKKAESEARDCGWDISLNLQPGDPKNKDFIEADLSKIADRLEVEMRKVESLEATINNGDVCCSSCVLHIKDLERKVNILEKKLEMAEHRHSPICGADAGKGWEKKFTCWVCEHERLERKVAELEKKPEECQVRWMDRGVKIMCGEPMPCRIHNYTESEVCKQTKIIEVLEGALKKLSTHTHVDSVDVCIGNSCEIKQALKQVEELRKDVTHG